MVLWNSVGLALVIVNVAGIVRGHVATSSCHVLRHADVVAQGSSPPGRAGLKTAGPGRLQGRAGPGPGRAGLVKGPARQKSNLDQCEVIRATRIMHYEMSFLWRILLVAGLFTYKIDIASRAMSTGPGHPGWASLDILCICSALS